MTLRDSVTAGEQALPAMSGGEVSSRRLALAGVAYCAVLAILWLIARFFHLRQLVEHPVSTFVSFALLFAPYWFFGFGAADWVRRALPGAGARIAAAALLTAPYFVLSLPRGEFHWSLAAGTRRISQDDDDERCALRISGHQAGWGHRL